MSLTIFLAELAGLTTAIIGLACLCQRKVILKVLLQLEKDRPLLFVLGVIDAVAGLAIILVHNDWSGGALSTIVTLIGWGQLLRGSLRMTLSEDAIKRWTKLVDLEKNYTLIATSALVLGLALAWAGTLAAHS